MLSRDRVRDQLPARSDLRSVARRGGRAATRIAVVMIACDVGRAVLISLVAIPGTAGRCAAGAAVRDDAAQAPFDASRSALLPRILTGDAVRLRRVAADHDQQHRAGLRVFRRRRHRAVLIRTPRSLVDAADLPRFGALVQARASGTATRSPSRRSRVAVADPRDRGRIPAGAGPPGAARDRGRGVRRVDVRRRAGGPRRGLGRHARAQRVGRGVDQAVIMMSVPVGAVLGAIVVAGWSGRRPAAGCSDRWPCSSRSRSCRPCSTSTRPASPCSPASPVRRRRPDRRPPTDCSSRRCRARSEPGRSASCSSAWQLVQAVGLFATGAHRRPRRRYRRRWAVERLGVCVMLAAGLLWPSAQRIDETIARCGWRTPR